mmetsp:Transcript_31756/g.91255  ORF Transcript_31756/g.91255 Transcript_31756/m.91255 type:complete len:258 (+) Transcript_31756:382-1155(+)
MPLRSRLRAFLTDSNASGNIINRKFGKPHTANDGDTRGRPMEACNFPRRSSMFHSTRMYGTPATFDGNTVMHGAGSSTDRAWGSAAPVCGACRRLSSPGGGNGLGAAILVSTAGTSLPGSIGSATVCGNANPGGARSLGEFALSPASLEVTCAARCVLAAPRAVGGEVDAMPKAGDGSAGSGPRGTRAGGGKDERSLAGPLVPGVSAARSAPRALRGRSSATCTCCCERPSVPACSGTADSLLSCSSTAESAQSQWK